MKNRLIRTVFLFIISCSAFYQSTVYSAADEYSPLDEYPRIFSEYQVPDTPRSCSLQKLNLIKTLLETIISNEASRSVESKKLIPEDLVVRYLKDFIDRLEYKIENGVNLNEPIPDFFTHAITLHKYDIHTYDFIKEMETFIRSKLDRSIQGNYACAYFDITLNVFRHLIRTELQGDYLRNSHTLPKILMVEMQNSLKPMEFKFSTYKLSAVLKSISMQLDKSYVLSNHLDLFKIYYVAFKDYQERFGMSQKEKAIALKLIVNVWFVTYVSPILVNKHQDSALAKKIQGIFSTKEGSWTTKPKWRVKKARKEITEQFLEILENVQYSYY